jgi:Protein of unknown function (DUF2635)
MRIHVTPAAGRSVRDPSNPAAGHLPAEGRVAEDNSAWRRLESAGDVAITMPVEPVAEAAPDSSAKPKK